MALDANERPDLAIQKFESMLKTDDVYFFDAEDFEEIIHYYLNQGKATLGKKAIEIGLQQHPHSTVEELFLSFNYLSLLTLSNISNLFLTLFCCSSS